MTRLHMLMNSYYSGANAWFALAEERGFFAEEGVELAITAGNGAFRAPRMLMEGGYDLTFGDMCSLIGLAAESGAAAPAAIYTLHHRSPSAIAVPIDSPIHVPADLEGRHIIGHLSDVAMRSFPAYARAAGIDLAKVSTAISDDIMADMLKTMLAGGADGVFGYVSSQRAVLRQSDPALADRQRFLLFPDVAPDLYGSVIIASRSAIADVPAAIDAVLARNPALDRQVELDRWQGTIAEEFNHPETRQIGFGAIDMDRLTRSATDLADTIPLKTRVPASDLFDARFLPALADRIDVAKACGAALYETI
jgi:NitT/TauT family transport system substrate-binding protein